MMPVTSRAGVTSKPGFATGVPSGANRTVAIAPAAPRPESSTTSLAARSSIITSRPSATVQSIDDDGAAT
jgi:hypothetical protein